MTDTVDKALAWDAIIRARMDAVIRARMDEREQCAKLAERFADQGRDGHQIANAIRSKGQLRGSGDVGTPGKPL